MASETEGAYAAVEPRWIDEPLVAAIHRRQVAEHGGIDGTRDAGLLRSALARPRNLFAYAEDPVPDLAALAAAYAFGIARNHPFLDGNKRTALVVCRVFLRINAGDFAATQIEKHQTFLALAAGEVSEDALTQWIRERLTTRRGQ